MITLIANDETQVTLSAKAAETVPYIADAYWDFDEFYKDPEKILHAPFASGAQLQLLKMVLEIKESEGGSFIPMKGTVSIGALTLMAPPFVELQWSSEGIGCFMQSLNEKQIIDLFDVANGMCITELRTAVIILILHKIITKQMTFGDFFINRSEVTLKLFKYIYEQPCFS